MTRRKPLSLYELNQLIRSVIDTALSDTFLVTAEIASLTVKNHCYLSLVDKDDDTVRAEMSAVIWANRYKTVKADLDRKSTRLNSSHIPLSRMPSSA